MKMLRALDKALEHLIFEVAPRRPKASLALLAALGLGLFQSFAPATTPSLDADAPANQYLLDRPWLDNLPVNPTPDNPTHCYFFQAGDQTGVYVTFLSRYRQEMELIYYKKIGNDKIEIYLPETRTKARGTFKIADDTSPSQFDLRMDLSNDPKKVGTYYSLKDWGQGQEGALSPELLARVKSFLAQAKANPEAAAL